jgi:nucleoside 2-deoxyribosyltransferase
MRVYLAAAMTHTGRDLGAILALLRCLEEDDHAVPSRHVADPRGRGVEGPVTDSEIARRDLDWVAGCDALVAEVSTPSHGVGVEVATALAARKPVFLVYRCGTAVSRMLLGLPGVEALAYANVREACEGVRVFLAGVRAARTASPAAR